MELSEAEKRIGAAMHNLWKREHPEVIEALRLSHSSTLDELLAIINASIKPFNARYECPHPLSGEFIFDNDEDLVSFVLTYGE